MWNASVSLGKAVWNWSVSSTGATWNWLFKKTPPPPLPPPPVILVPPIFDFPPLDARTSMTVPAYDILFGKMALDCLFKDYFEKARHFTARIMLKPMGDPHVDLVATISGFLNNEKEGNAVFRWQRDLDDPHNFFELSVSTSEQMLLFKSCAYHPTSGLGVFCKVPLLRENRGNTPNYGTIGLRYGSESLSLGTMVAPYTLPGEFPLNAWIVKRFGKFSTGAQYKPEGGRELSDLKNWNLAVGYDMGVISPLRPSFNFGLEFAKGSELVSSFYQHIVVQRRVTNPLEQCKVVGITNYIDLGFELRTRYNGESPDLNRSSFQMAASWQANKNFLLKGKLGSSSSSAVLAFKSWWNPSFTFSISAFNDHTCRTTSYGFGIRMENLRDARYERADPNYVMLTPSKEHLADGVLQEWGKRPMFQSEIDSENYDSLPRELRPTGKII